MFLRLFLVSFLFFSFAVSASDASQFEDHQSNFNNAKNSILAKMEEMLGGSESKKLDIFEVVKNGHIQDFIKSFPNITTQSIDGDAEQIKNLLNQLLDSNFDTARFIDKSGQSLAKTYLHQGNDPSTEVGNSSSSSSSGGGEPSDAKILRAIKIYDLTKKSDEDDEQSDSGSNEAEDLGHEMEEEETEPEHFYELLSCLFIKKKIDEKIGGRANSEGNIRIDFSEVEIASFWTVDGLEKFVLIFKGANGQDVDALVQGENSFKTILPVARAFASLHQKTQFDGEPVYEEPNQNALENINKLLEEKLVYTLGDMGQRKEATPHAPHSIIHRDAHIGNIIYDQDNNLVTFIDYETAFESLFGGADPIRDLGCFMISVWTKILRARQDAGQVKAIYSSLKNFRDSFIGAYISAREDTNPLSEQNVLNQLKLHMWGYAGYFISGNFATLDDLKDETIKFLLETDLDEKWKKFYGLHQIESEVDQFDE